MTTDTTERGLEDRICGMLAGRADKSSAGDVGERPAVYGVGWRYGDRAYRNAREHSDEQNARIEHDKALGNAIMALLSDDTELYKQYCQNEAFKRWLENSVFELTNR